MARVFLLVLDSVGVGGAPDAADYGDAGSNTLGHIADACACGEGDLPGRRFGHLRLPNLARLGLGEAARLATGKLPADLLCPDGPKARIAAAAEVSAGKDTPSGHWEIAGLPVRFQWGMFPRTEPCFPATLTDALCAQAGLPGVLGNKHASGTTIIEELGAEHMRSGRPICYTSADSVLQIAAHEEFFGLDRLLEVCAVARRLVDPLNIGRVIARPFTGSPGSGFRRTANRRDFSVPPFGPTLLDLAVTGGREVVTIGKIGDIFAHTATGHEIKADGNDAVVNATLDTMSEVADGGFVFANLVDFDSLYGHRRDVGGYAEALEAFDARVPELLGRLRSGDLLIITADHGCDPTWAGTDHTREQVPILAFEPGRRGGSIGRRSTFADIAATAARHLGLPAPQAGSPL